MFIGARGQEFAFGGHEVHRQQVVDRQAVLAHEPAEPATERKPGDARVGDDTASRGEAEHSWQRYCPATMPTIDTSPLVEMSRRSRNGSCTRPQLLLSHG